MFSLPMALINILFLPVLFSGVEKGGIEACLLFEEAPAASETYFVSASSSVEIEIIREDFDLVHRMGWPVINPIVSSGYGSRETSCTSCSSYHRGTDFTPGVGTPVMAAMKGVVETVEHSGGYGTYVIIRHDLNDEIWHTVYAHMQRNSVPSQIRPGTEVVIGDIVGSVGNTGASTGPHLHFEVRIDGVKVNPLPLLQRYVSQDN